MSGPSYALFDTAIGICAIAWGAAGVRALQLPEGSAEAARARLARRFPTAVEATPPADVERAIAGIVALLAGEPRDLRDVVLDMTGVPEFHRRVYEVARGIPPGSTLTYGEIAARLGQPQAAREVGQALGANPFPIVVPCHRVLAAGGKAGGFSAHGGVDTKLKMLSIERARVGDAPSLFDDLPLAARPQRRR